MLGAIERRRGGPRSESLWPGASYRALRRGESWSVPRRSRLVTLTLPSTRVTSTFTIVAPHHERGSERDGRIRRLPSQTKGRLGFWVTIEKTLPPVLSRT